MYVYILENDVVKEMKKKLFEIFNVHMRHFMWYMWTMCVCVFVCVHIAETRNIC
jgi:hypothetical protein